MAYPDLLTPLRARLREAGAPYVIENLRDAPWDHGIVLCGTMFGKRFYRHRTFETSFPMLAPAHPIHRAVIGHGHGINYGRTRTGTPGWAAGYGHQSTREVIEAAFEIDWMNRDELSQAMPPVYGRYIGEWFLSREVA